MGPVPWLIVGVVLLVAEIFHTGFVLCWFGLAALAVAALAGLGMASVAAQLVVFAVASALLVVASRTLLRPILPRRNATPTNVDALLGAVGEAPHGVGLLPGEGRVTLQGIDWAARPHDDRPIPRGARVRVVSVEGVTLVVAPDLDAGN